VTSGGAPKCTTNFDCRSVAGQSMKSPKLESFAGAASGSRRGETKTESRSDFRSSL